MAHRNFSLVDYFIERGGGTVPSMMFRGEDFESWQSMLRSKVLELLGEFPRSIDLQPETIWRVEEDGFIKEKVVFDSEAHASVPAIVVKRADLDPTVLHRGILCIHGHGPHGKDSLAGVRISPEHRQVIEQHNYDYAWQFASAGFITISPDLRNFGERGSGNLYPGRDSCNVHFIRGLLMGINLITLNLWDLMKTLDYFCARPDVDANRIGCIGLSLIAPRPLLIESGILDEGFPIESSLAAYQHLQEIYRAAGAQDQLEQDVFEGGHQFSGRKAFSFFERCL